MPEITTLSKQLRVCSVLLQWLELSWATQLRLSYSLTAMLAAWMRRDQHCYGVQQAAVQAVQHNKAAPAACTPTSLACSWQQKRIGVFQETGWHVQRGGKQSKIGIPS